MTGLEIVEVPWCEACREIRFEVFVIGQSVPPELEVDGFDEGCAHFLARLAGVPVGTARVRPLRADEAKVERVAVVETARSRGIGARIMRVIEARARSDGLRVLSLSAQAPVISFYRRLGYHEEGPRFMEAGIEHQRMRLALDPIPSSESIC